MRPTTMFALATLLATVVAGTSCSANGGRARPGTTSSSPSTTDSRPSPIPWVTLDNDYGHNETFCAQAPLSGKIRYVVQRRQVTLRFAIHGLPADSAVGVYWINDKTRGYNIAFVRSGHAGTARQHTLRMYRGGEVRGQGMQLQSYTGRILGNLVPC